MCIRDSLQGDRDVSRKYTVGIATPSLSGNVGDVVYDGNAASGGLVGWIYTSQNRWEKFGRIGLNNAEPDTKLGIASAGDYVGLATQINFVGAGVTVTNAFNESVGIATFTFDANPKMGISTGAASGTNNLLGIGTQINFVGYGITIRGEFESITGIATIVLTGNSGVAGTSAPGGITNSVQYNNSGFFGGADGFTYDGTNVAVSGESASSLVSISQTGGGNALEVSGKVGIGTSATAQLEVVTSSGEALRLKSTAGTGNIVRIDSGTTTGDANPVIVDVSGNLGVNTVSAIAPLDVLGNVAITGESRLYESTRSYYAALKPPALESNVTLTLPTRVGVSSDVLITTGNGVLDYISASSIVGLALTNSDDVDEGTNNLYFTNERAQDAVDSAITSGIQTGITITYSDSGNSLNFNVDNASPYPFTTKGFPGSF